MVCRAAVSSARVKPWRCRLRAGSHRRHIDIVQRRSDGPSGLEERDLTARRIVAERCLYGVDVNPLAVDIAKVSLWLTTLRRDRPFTFVDHALRCGDSLLGLTSLDQLEVLTLKREAVSYTRLRA